MKITFPVYVAWRLVEKSRRQPITHEVDGFRCLAIFEDYGQLLNFRVKAPPEDEGQDHIEPLTARQLRAFLNGVLYRMVVLNPYSDSEAVYEADELLSYINGQLGQP